MSAFYDRMAATALRLIDQFGQTITVRNPTEGSYDPVTGTTTPGLPNDQPAQAILKDYALQQSGASYAEGTEIRQGDKEITIAAHGVAKPLMTTQIIADGVTWTIVSIKEINPAGTALVYKVQGRR